ncbi:MAG TPA: K(+)-transporting ATPase subunit F [Nitrosospira sp.]|nr:K(+)-transporting ATPase subunit F [Nitrosospira sp.]
MNALYAAGAIIAAILLIYLLIALINAEDL